MAKITKIVIEIGKKKIELTADEAKELRASLNDVFTDKTEYVPWYPITPTQPYYQTTSSAFGVDSTKPGETPI